MFIKSIRSVLFTLLLFAVNNTTALHSTNPKVVVSITPFYALVAAVMQGVGTPQLLVKPNFSPHEYALRTSEIQLIKEADVLFWAGPLLETFLVKPLQNFAKKEPVPLIVELDKTPGLLLLPLRQNSAWDPHKHGDVSNIDSTIDMHFWLDPNNAIILTDTIVKTLATLDPIHASLYQQNGKNLKARLKKLDVNIAAQLKEVRKVPYVVFHDAYQYFEHRYGLNGVGAITLHPEMPPSAKRLTTIRDTIKKTNARCVFTEPQFQPKLVYSIIQDLQVNSEELNAEGQESQKNANGYFELLENLSNAMKHCLSNNLRPSH